jgi:hypothetical protein
MLQTTWRLVQGQMLQGRADPMARAASRGRKTREACMGHLGLRPAGLTLFIGG